MIFHLALNYSPIPGNLREGALKVFENRFSDEAHGSSRKRPNSWLQSLYFICYSQSDCESGLL